MCMLYNLRLLWSKVSYWCNFEIRHFLCIVVSGFGWLYVNNRLEYWHDFCAALPVIGKYLQNIKRWKNHKNWPKNLHRRCTWHECINWQSHLWFDLLFKVTEVNMQNLENCEWGWHRSKLLHTVTCNLARTDLLMNPDRMPKTRSVWPSLEKSKLVSYSMTSFGAQPGLKSATYQSQVHGRAVSTKSQLLYRWKLHD